MIDEEDDAKQTKFGPFRVARSSSLPRPTNQPIEHIGNELSPHFFLHIHVVFWWRENGLGPLPPMH